MNNVVYIDATYKKADEKALQTALSKTSTQQSFMPIVSLDMLINNKIDAASYDDKQEYVLLSSFCQNDYLPVYGIVKTKATLRSIPFDSCFIDSTEYTSYGALVSPSCTPNCNLVAIQKPSSTQIIAVAITPQKACRVVNTPLSVANYYSHAVLCTCTSTKTCTMIVSPCSQSEMKIPSLYKWLSSNIEGRIFTTVMSTFKASSNTMETHETLLTQLYRLDWYVLLYDYIILYRKCNIGNNETITDLIGRMKKLEDQKNTLKTFGSMIRFAVLLQHYSTGQCGFKMNQQACDVCNQVYQVFIVSKSTIPSSDAIRKQLSRMFMLDFFIYFVQHAIFQFNSIRAVLRVDNPRADASDKWISRIVEALADLFRIDCMTLSTQDTIIALVNALQTVDYDADNQLRVARLKRFNTFIASTVKILK